MKTIERVPKKSVVAVLLSSACMAMSGCGGSGGSSSAGSDVPGLDIPEKISLVEAKNGGAAGDGLAGDGLAGDGLAGDGLAGDLNSDFATDVANTYVYDPAMEALEAVNQILCFIGQTGASQRVNAGPYVALINETPCDRESSSGGAQAGANAPDYVPWVVDVQRASANAPQTARFWLPSDGDGSSPLDDPDVLADLTVYAAPSATLPNGDFVLNFKGVVDAALVGAAGTELTVMQGTLKTIANSSGEAQLSFYNESGSTLPGLSALGVNESSLARVNVMSSGAQVGRALSSVSQTNGASTFSATYAVDYNITALQRGTDANDNQLIEPAELKCLSRDDVDTFGWQYNLYDAASGQRVELNSGFSFSELNGVPQMGYIGYWGAWLDGGARLEDGDQILRESESAQPAQTLSVAVSDAKLEKRGLETVAFADLVGSELTWYGDVSDANCAGGCANMQSNRVSIDAAGTVLATHRLDDSGGQESWVERTPAVDITPALAGDTLNLWSDALGGSVSYQHGSGALDVYSSRVLAPNSSELNAQLNLVCYENCPIGGLFAPTVNDDLYYGYGRQSYTLSVSNNRYSLIDDSNSLAVALRDASGLGNQADSAAIYSGPMVELSDDPGLAMSWQIYAAANSYIWISGPQEWNRSTMVVDANAQAISFDQPLQFFYNYSAGDDPNIAASLVDHPAGNAYRLGYGGAGNLWGFPYTAAASCNSGQCPSYPAITLADGVLLGANDQYVVRRVESEQHMREDVAGCTGLDAVAAVADPQLALPTAVDGVVSFALSDRPVLSGVAPAVIEGVVQ